MSPAPLRTVLRDISRRPVEHLLRRWNYKSAVLSSLTRGALFFVANLSSGRSAALTALTTEFWFRFATAGFYGALTQAFRRVHPPRTGTIAAAIILPLVAHTLELLVHWWRGTANLGFSLGLSVCLTTLSTSFSLFAMRRGALSVGDHDSRSLWADVRHLPRLLFTFAGVTCLHISQGLAKRFT